MSRPLFRILIVTPKDISTMAHFVPLLFVTLPVFYQHVHWHAQTQDFLPGGFRPDCQKTALTAFVLVLNLFYSFTEDVQWLFQRKL